MYLQYIHVSKYYIYVYYDPRKNDEPIYVGRGQGRRYLHHLSKATNHMLERKIQHIRDCGLEPKVVIELENLSLEEANTQEREMIQRFGRVIDSTGTLCNFTAGGEGTDGYTHRDDTKQLFSSQRKGKRQTPAQYKANCSREPQSPEVIEKRVAHFRGKKQSPEFVEKRMQSIRGFKHSAETKALWSQHRKGKKQTEEHIANMKAAAHAKWDLKPGQLFGEWTVIEKCDLPETNRYICQCSCGVVRNVITSTLRSGRSKSCGHRHKKS